MTVVGTIFGCGDGPTDPLLELEPDIRPFVAGGAADSLDANGHFIIAPDLTSNDENVPLITAARARELAAAFTVSYGPPFLKYWEADRGASIDLAALAVSPRVFPALTAFGEFPNASCHPSFVRLFGSYYLISLNHDGAPIVRMAVSAQTTDYSVDASNNIVEPPLTGSDFVHEGIPARSAYVLTPEQAVALVARTTGARIIHVPQLFLQRNDAFAPTFVLWRVDLDAAVPVTRLNGQRETTTVLYLDALGRFYLPKALQPRSVTQRCLTVDSSGEFNGEATVTVPISRNVPVDFERVSIDGANP